MSTDDKTYEGQCYCGAVKIVVTQRTVEAHIRQILQRLGLRESPDDHRRVLAVLAYLRA